MSGLEDALGMPCPSGLGDLGGAWDMRVSHSLESLLALASPNEVELTSGRAWALLGWVERMASHVTRVHDPAVLDQAIFALLWIGRSRVIDTREAILVGGLLRRGAALAGLDFADRVDYVKAVIGDDPTFSWLASLSAKLPPTHQEMAVEGGVELRRLPSGIDVTELMKQFGR